MRANLPDVPIPIPGRRRVGPLSAVVALAAAVAVIAVAPALVRPAGPTLVPTAAGLPGDAGLPTAAANPPTLTLSAANDPTLVPNPVGYNETSPLVVVRGAHISRTIDTAAAMPDSMTPASTSHQTFSAELRTDSVLMDVQFRTSGQRYRIWVDGHPTTLDPTTSPAGGAFYRVTIRFAARAVRTVRFESDGINFKGFTVSRTDLVTAPPAPGTRAVIVGDSFAEGTGAVARFSAFGQLFCYRVGWDDCWVDGSGGTGYLATGTPTYTGRVKYRDRIVHDVLQYNPQVVVITGGKNDFPWTTAQVGAEALALFQQIKQALPGVVLIVTSPFPSSGSQAQSASYLAMGNALRAAATSAGADYYLDVLGSNAYLTGTGNAGKPNGTGNADLYISADGIHPTQAGHDALAAALFAQYARQVAGTPSSPASSPTGSSTVPTSTSAPAAGTVTVTSTLTGPTVTVVGPTVTGPTVTVTGPTTTVTGPTVTVTSVPDPVTVTVTSTPDPVTVTQTVTAGP